MRNFYNYYDNVKFTSQLAIVLRKVTTKSLGVEPLSGHLPEDLSESTVVKLGALHPLLRSGLH